MICRIVEFTRTKEHEKSSQFRSTNTIYLYKKITKYIFNINTITIIISKLKGSVSPNQKSKADFEASSFSLLAELFASGILGAV